MRIALGAKQAGVGLPNQLKEFVPVIGWLSARDTRLRIAPVSW